MNQNQSGDRVPAIRVEGLEKLYREVLAVDRLSFSVEPGEILGLIGPNGAGKTSTLRMIAGILPPTRGRVEIVGRDLSLDPTGSKRLLAYVPDEPNIFESLTVMEHLQFIASAYGVKDWQERVAELLRIFELEEKESALGSELSRGMRQKLVSACALLHTPRVLLIDEPMTGLDPRGIRTMNRAILDMAASGAAVVVSSHLLAMVERLCTSVLVLHHGQALLKGKLEEIRGRFPELASDASLEEVFFRATESSAGVNSPEDAEIPQASEADGSPSLPEEKSP